MSDEEIETLESYLDGALAPDETQRLCRRLEDEPELREAMEGLRAERAARQAAWRSFEPGPATAASFSSRTVASVVRQDRLARATRLARRITAVAACLVLAFAGGWVARGRVSSIGAVTDVAAGPGAYQVALTDERGNIIAVQRFTDAEQAKAFAEDVGRWQSRPRRAEPREREFLQTSDEF